MKKLLLLLPLIGCGPYFLDLTAGIGSNQKISKTLDVDQKQTKAQTEANSSALDAIVSVLPIFAAPKPSPTPEVPKIKSIVINVEPQPTPEIIYQESFSERTLSKPKPSPTPKPKPKPKPTPKPFKDCCANAPYEASTPFSQN